MIKWSTNLEPEAQLTHLGYYFPYFSYSPKNKDNNYYTGSSATVYTSDNPTTDVSIKNNTCIVCSLHTEKFRELGFNKDATPPDKPQQQPIITPTVTTPPDPSAQVLWYGGYTNANGVYTPARYAKIGGHEDLGGNAGYGMGDGTGKGYTQQIIKDNPEAKNYQESVVDFCPCKGIGSISEQADARKQKKEYERERAIKYNNRMVSGIINNINSNYLSGNIDWIGPLKSIIFISNVDKETQNKLKDEQRTSSDTETCISFTYKHVPISISCNGPKSRYFYDELFTYDPKEYVESTYSTLSKEDLICVSNVEIYRANSLIAVAPFPVLGVAAKQVTIKVYNEQSKRKEDTLVWHIFAICKSGLSDVIYTAILNEEGWSSRIHYESEKALSKSNEVTNKVYKDKFEYYKWTKRKVIDKQSYSSQTYTSEAKAARTPWFFNSSCTKAVCTRQQNVTYWDGNYSSNGSKTTYTNEGLHVYSLTIPSSLDGDFNFKDSRNTEGFTLIQQHHYYGIRASDFYAQNDSDYYRRQQLGWDNLTTEQQTSLINNSSVHLGNCGVYGYTLGGYSIGWGAGGSSYYFFYYAEQNIAKLAWFSSTTNWDSDKSGFNKESWKKYHPLSYPWVSYWALSSCFEDNTNGDTPHKIIFYSNGNQCKDSDWRTHFYLRNALEQYQQYYGNYIVAVDFDGDVEITGTLSMDGGITHLQEFHVPIDRNKYFDASYYKVSPSEDIGKYQVPSPEPTIPGLFWGYNYSFTYINDLTPGRYTAIPGGLCGSEFSIPDSIYNDYPDNFSKTTRAQWVTPRQCASGKFIPDFLDGTTYPFYGNNIILKLIFTNAKGDQCIPIFYTLVGDETIIQDFGVAPDKLSNPAWKYEASEKLSNYDWVGHSLTLFINVNRHLHYLDMRSGVNSDPSSSNKGIGNHFAAFTEIYTEIVIDNRGETSFDPSNYKVAKQAVLYATLVVETSKNNYDEAVNTYNSKLSELQDADIANRGKDHYWELMSPYEIAWQNAKNAKDIAYAEYMSAIAKRDKAQLNLELTNGYEKEDAPTPIKKGLMPTSMKMTRGGAGTASGVYKILHKEGYQSGCYPTEYVWERDITINSNSQKVSILREEPKNITPLSIKGRLYGYDNKGRGGQVDGNFDYQRSNGWNTTLNFASKYDDGTSNLPDASFPDNKVSIDADPHQIGIDWNKQNWLYTIQTGFLCGNLSELCKRKAYDNTIHPGYLVEENIYIDINNISPRFHTWYGGIIPYIEMPTDWTACLYNKKMFNTQLNVEIDFTKVEGSWARNMFAYMSSYKRPIIHLTNGKDNLVISAEGIESPDTYINYALGYTDTKKPSDLLELIDAGYGKDDSKTEIQNENRDMSKILPLKNLLLKIPLENTDSLPEDMKKENEKIKKIYNSISHYYPIYSIGF